jgi:hypothetical protein
MKVDEGSDTLYVFTKATIVLCLLAMTCVVCGILNCWIEDRRERSRQLQQRER